jgi:hypothetical protein
MACDKQFLQHLTKVLHAHPQRLAGELAGSSRRPLLDLCACGREKNRAQEDPIRNIASGANSIGPKASKSLMLIEHRPSHLN